MDNLPKNLSRYQKTLAFDNGTGSKGIIPATGKHALLLARALSADHRREIADAAGISPIDAIRMSMDASLESYAFVPGGVMPVFMMGVEATGRLTGGAMLWMLASDAIRGHAPATVRAARWGLCRAFAVGGAERLEQYIPEWYATGLRFARRLGFSIDPVPCRGRNGAALLHVVLERKEMPWGR
ncbi:MAG: hypothetical protein LBS30_01800 [Planctomycetota bacterium]|nr:hypothetical protein [Planctomycetota bacterium]